MAYQKTSETIRIDSLKNSQRETLERFVNGQHMFVMYESFSSGTLDNKVNKESQQAKHSEHGAQERKPLGK